MIEPSLKEIREQIESARRAVLSGSIEDYAAYRYLTGRLHGLESAEQSILEQIEKRSED